MARKQRDFAVGESYHMVMRGNNRRRIFSYPSDYGYFCWQIYRALKQGGVSIHALCLLANHVHAIVTVQNELALPRFVQSVAQNYARYRNLKREASGKLFEQRYYAERIDSEANLAACTTYIDLNPVRAGVVATPELYPWSTASLHLGTGNGRIASKLWTPSDWYLGLHDEAELRVGQYNEWLSASLARDLEARLVGVNATDRAVESYTRRLERPNRKRAL